MNQCIFCDIINKKIPSHIIYIDKNIIAFHDIKPVSPIHFLVIPKQHIDTLIECKTKHTFLLGQMLLRAQKLAQQEKCRYKTDKNTKQKVGGFKILFNIGPNGGQEIYHLHMHVIGYPTTKPKN